MSLLNVGRDFYMGVLTGAVTSPLFNNANSYIAVGDGTDAFDATDTDLQGTNKFRKGMDATYPIRTLNAVIFQATFAGAEANYAWEEWGVANASSAGTMLNRKVEYNGTKLAGQTWIFQVTLTLNTV